ncbi:uncharacterized protein An02g03550 [Aspergillus niger]|uniref:Contig An02c0090, genomic contig n=2 Tax=Aspergillus niger TaxID=5061 RepID=A2QCH1_ASPNC|nr:uncharacterized protein An02g03550 [Aspergillus niger]CAK47635.1 unnamed protein product [Aspergillus niger]
MEVKEFDAPSVGDSPPSQGLEDPILGVGPWQEKTGAQISRARRQANEVGDSEARGRRVHWMLRERVLEWGESGETVWREPEQATTNGEMWTLLCDDDDDDDDDVVVVVIVHRFHLSLYRVGISRSATQNVLPQCDRDTDPEGEH